MLFTFSPPNVSKTVWEIKKILAYVFYLIQHSNKQNICFDLCTLPVRLLFSNLSQDFSARTILEPEKSRFDVQSKFSSFSTLLLSSSVRRSLFARGGEEGCPVQKCFSKKRGNIFFSGNKKMFFSHPILTKTRFFLSHFASASELCAFLTSVLKTWEKNCARKIGTNHCSARTSSNCCW